MKILEIYFSTNNGIARSGVRVATGHRLQREYVSRAATPQLQKPSTGKGLELEISEIGHDDGVLLDGGGCCAKLKLQTPEQREEGVGRERERERKTQNQMQTYLLII